METIDQDLQAALETFHGYLDDGELDRTIQELHDLFDVNSILDDAVLHAYGPLEFDEHNELIHRLATAHDGTIRGCACGASVLRIADSGECADCGARRISATVVAIPLDVIPPGVHSSTRAWFVREYLGQALNCSSRPGGSD